MKKLIIIISLILNINLTLKSAEIKESQESSSKKRESDINQMLKIAIIEKDSKAVNSAIAHGANVNFIYQDHYKDTPLILALQFCDKSWDEEIFQLLISKGANVNKPDRNGRTPLIIAAQLNHRIEIINMLIEAGADVNLQDGEGNTALMYSKMNKVSQTLIKAGSDVNLQNKQGRTALMNGYNSIEKTKLLLNAGADMNIQDKDGNTALIIAAMSGSTEIVKLLIEYGKLIKKRLNEELPVFPEALTNLTATYAIPDLNVQDKDGNTALMKASKSGYKEIVEILISKKADLNVQNKEGNTALILAASKGNKEIVELLTKAGADVDIQNKNGETASTIKVKEKKLIRRR